MKDNYSSIVEFLENKGLLTESFDLEFKSAKGGFPKSFWETYSSFANTEGGIIILGISEKDEQCFYDGLPQMGCVSFKMIFGIRLIIGKRLALIYCWKMMYRCLRYKKDNLF